MDRGERELDSRSLAALLSSLLSQLLVSLFILLPSSGSTSNDSVFPLLHHLHSTSEIATCLSLSLSRKRKRTHQTGHDVPDDGDGTRPKPAQLGRFDSAIPWSPDSFRTCFKMTSSTFEWLSTLLEPLLECRDPVGSPLNLPAETRLGIGIFRLATGSDYPEISRRFGVSEPVTKFCIKQFCRVLCTNFRFWVGFPTPNELEMVSSEFKTLTGLPNCCGIIDCPRFNIVTSNGYQSNSQYILQEESIAAQIVVDSSSRILSIIAGFRGEKGNSKILKSSTLCKDIEDGNLLNLPPVHVNDVGIPQYLVGGGGYPLLPWLLVPFVDPIPGSCEEHFNELHGLMRLSAVRTVASLRNWGVLSKPIEADVKTMVAYIGACSILHNAMLMREDYSAFYGGAVDDSLLEQSSQYYRDTGFEGNLIETKASEIRRTLANRVTKLH
ncbi:hypothetical protein RJ639_047481 [Escallonia herrerae]|uniref:DDE Tnp4 domain-containing protein n=1 Tax=Escallonia herrerae TaxID=1293975 RepID=A0AA89B186_9ASTE|nr:hypothetical protein RJ639_047481 [Escallonia herrerae]